MKPFIAAIAGILSAIVFVRLGEMAGHFLFPLDAAQLNIDNISMRDLMLHLPLKVLLSVVVAHFIGLIIGLFVARLIDKSTMLPLYFVSGIMLLLSLINVLILPHPMWFVLADLGLQLLVAILFFRVVRKK